MRIIDFAAELGRYLNETDSTSLILPIKLHLRSVFRDIGYDYTCEVVHDRFRVKGGVVKKNDSMVSVIDVSRNEFSERNRGSGVRTGHGQIIPCRSLVNFHESIRSIEFPESIDRDSHMWIKYYTFPTDGDGMEVIDGSVYLACLSYMKSVMLPSRPYHPDYRRIEIIKQECYQEIDKARADLHNSSSPASRRQMRR